MKPRRASAPVLIEGPYRPARARRRPLVVAAVLLLAVLLLLLAVLRLGAAPLIAVILPSAP